jgi:hypothetical protein
MATAPSLLPYSHLALVEIGAVRGLGWLLRGAVARAQLCEADGSDDDGDDDDDDDDDDVNFDNDDDDGGGGDVDDAAAGSVSGSGGVANGGGDKARSDVRAVSSVSARELIRRGVAALMLLTKPKASSPSSLPPSSAESSSPSSNETSPQLPIACYVRRHAVSALACAASHMHQNRRAAIVARLVDLLSDSEYAVRSQAISLHVHAIAFASNQSACSRHFVCLQSAVLRVLAISHCRV